MAKLTFYGATGTVTGSRFLLELRQQQFLIDCGLFQGRKENRRKNWEPFPVSPGGITHVLITHAHIDHTGYLPRLCKQGFSGPIFCTRATHDLCSILLPDSAHLQEEDARWANKKGFSKHKPALPLYTVADAHQALQLFRPVYYGDDIYLDGDVRVKFRDAGHILGSAYIDIKVGQRNASRKIIFSGDLGRPGKPILKEPTQPFHVDYLVLESTYGNRLHEGLTPKTELSRIINESVERGGVLLIPAFAVGRTQTLLYLIRELEETRRIPSIPVYIDSPMAIDATRIFRSHIPEQNLTSRLLTLMGKRLFRPSRLHIGKTRDQSRAINDVRSKAVIISASGMATGGRILHHLEQRLPHRENTILFVGYQAEGTRGRSILEGQPQIKIHGKFVPVKARVEHISGFSGHADYNEILAWLMGFNRPPDLTFLVHGENNSSEALAHQIREQFGWNVVIPSFGQTFELDL